MTARRLHAARLGALAAALVAGLAADATAQAQVQVIQRQIATSPVFVAQGTLSADAQAISTTATWNNAGVTFTGWKENITDTNSNASSLLLDLQVGGSSKFSVRKDGAVTANGSVQGNGGLTAGSGSLISWGGGSRMAGSTDGVITLLNNPQTGFSRLNFGGTTSSFTALKSNGTSMSLRLADDSANATFFAGGYGLGNVWASGTGPTAPSSCGTSPAVTTTNGTVAWVVTGGTGGTATGCTVTMPTATNGWNCYITNSTQTAAHRADRTTVQTGSTTTSVTWEYQTVSTGAATAFTASDVFRGICFAY